MISGYCPVCETLVRLIPGKHKSDAARQRWYWTVQHEAGGKPCEGGRL